jgi:hypothetical protein
MAGRKIMADLHVSNSSVCKTERSWRFCVHLTLTCAFIRSPSEPVFFNSYSGLKCGICLNILIIRIDSTGHLLPRPVHRSLWCEVNIHRGEQTHGHNFRDTWRRQAHPHWPILLYRKETFTWLSIWYSQDSYSSVGNWPKRAVSMQFSSVQFKRSTFIYSSSMSYDRARG